MKRAVMESAVVALVAEFIGAVTRVKPPVERELFPPEMKPALDRLCDGLMQLAKEEAACDDDWQPIETAPKDGTRILVYRPGKHNHPAVGVDFWQVGHAPYDVWWHSPSNGQPTHWMSLPPPPKGD